ncbi:MAG: hypothetical protein WAV56_00705 [Microgenomates group bacterium]
MKVFLPLIIIVLVTGIGLFVWQKSSGTQPISLNKESSSRSEAWTEKGIVIAGKFADADVVDIGGGKFRMYYSAEPETPQFQGQVYSAISSDGEKWTTEGGTRITQAIFPSVIKLSDGRFRMYFQERREIKSAISPDGLTWSREDGARINTSNPAGITLSGVLAPTVLSTGNEYLMVYAGAIDQAYAKEKVPNRETHLLFWATSGDGLSFTVKGIALDSRNDVFKGWLDGPKLVKWDDGSVRLFLFGYSGIYESVFDDQNFSEPRFVFYGPNFDGKLFPSDPPGDPTLAKIGDTWNMYYGYHTKGIYRAVLNK